MVDEGFALSAVRAAAENTLVAYRRDLDDCCVGLAQDGEACQPVRQKDLRALLVWWHQRGLAPRSVARRLSALRQFMGWAVDEGSGLTIQIAGSTTVLPATLPKSLGEAESVQLLDAAARLTPASPRSGGNYA